MHILPFRVIHRWFGLRSPTKSLRDLDPPYMNKPGRGNGLLPAAVLNLDATALECPTGRRG